MGIGEWAALTAALFWTISSLFWARINLSALTLNVGKNIVASLLIGVHLLVLATFTGETSFNVSIPTWGWMGISGLVGIVLGDTFYFRSIQILGPRLAMMVATTAPILSALLGWLVLSENLGWLSVLGILIVVSGVGVVVADRAANKEKPNLIPGTHSAGIMLGILGAICQAVGGALSKIGMENCDALMATFIRLFVAAIITTSFVVLQNRFRRLAKDILQWKVIKILIPATVFGTWMGIWFSQIAFKESSHIAVAQTLMATCPLFAIPVVYILDGHRTSKIAIIGTVVAILGIFLVVNQID